MYTIPAHINGITSVVFSPDGEALATAGQDGRVSVWDKDNGQLLVHCKGHSGGIMGISFTKNGKRIASASKDGTIKMWDARTGQDLKTFLGHNDLVTSVAFSPDGMRIASASLDKTVKIWDAATAKDDAKQFIGQHNKAIVAVAFSADGKRVISRDSSKKTVVWNASDATVIEDAKDPAPKESPAAISPDGKKLALPFASWFYVIELEPAKDEASYRDSMSRLKWWWHEEQASKYEKQKAWYAAAYHLSWTVRANPENRARFDAACKNLSANEVAQLSRQAGIK